MADDIISKKRQYINSYLEIFAFTGLWWRRIKKVRFSADAVSYLLDANPVASEESLEKHRHPETRQGERIRCAVRSHVYLYI